MTDQAPGEFDIGGVRAIVPLSMVVTVASGRKEIMVRAALALGRAASEAPRRADVRIAIAFFSHKAIIKFLHYHLGLRHPLKLWEFL